MEQENPEKLDLTRQEQESLDFLFALAEAGDLYALLGVAPQAETSAIRKSFYEMSRQWHPDRFYRKKLGNYAERLELVFVTVTQAYHTLIDPDSRAAYDSKYRRSEGSLKGPARKTDDGTVITDRHDGIVHEVSWFTPGAGKGAGQTVGVVSLEAAGPESTNDRGFAPYQEPPAAAPPGEPSRKQDPGRDVSRPVEQPVRVERKVVVEIPPIKPQPEPPRPASSVIPAVDKLKKQLMAQFAKAKGYHDEAVREASEGNFVKAASSLYLATRYDPQNREYKALLDQYQAKGRTQLAMVAIHHAENAESYHDVRTATQAYEKACSYEAPVGLPYFRLAQIRQREEADAKDILRLYRTAVEKEPDNVKYRMALAQHLVEIGMEPQARREYTQVLRLQPTNAEAKDALKKVRG